MERCKTCKYHDVPATHEPCINCWGAYRHEAKDEPAKNVVPVTTLIERIAERFCMHYCKYHNDSYECEMMLCNNCPFGELC